MTNTAAYLIIFFSPTVYLLLMLNIRYTIVYNVLRKKHSNTYLKKQKESFFRRVFFKKFKTEISAALYYANWFLSILTVSSFLLSLSCLLALAFGNGVQLELIAHWYLKADILCVLALIIKQIYDKLLMA